MLVITSTIVISIVSLVLSLYSISQSTSNRLNVLSSFDKKVNQPSQTFTANVNEKGTVVCDGGLLVIEYQDPQMLKYWCKPLPQPFATPSPIASTSPRASASSFPSSSLFTSPDNSPIPTASPLSGVGVPFGPFHLPKEQFGTTAFSGGMYSTTSLTDLGSTLQAAQKNQVKLLINLAGGRNRFQKADGAFDLTKFKSQLDRYKNFDFTPYISDGTIIGHLLIDEPQDGSNWNGTVVPLTDIEAAAAYSKSLWPEMLTAVGSNPGFLKTAGANFWQNLDFTSTPYTSKKGDINTWKLAQIADAKEAGLGILFSINVLDGGSGSTKDKQVAVGAVDLQNWSTILLTGDTYGCGLTYWKWEKTDNGAYFVQSDIASAISQVAQVAQSRARASCQK